MCLLPVLGRCTMQRHCLYHCLDMSHRSVRFLLFAGADIERSCLSLDEVVFMIGQKVEEACDLVVLLDACRTASSAMNVQRGAAIPPAFSGRCVCMGCDRVSDVPLTMLRERCELCTLGELRLCSINY